MNITTIKHCLKQDFHLDRELKFDLDPASGRSEVHGSAEELDKLHAMDRPVDWALDGSGCSGPRQLHSEQRAATCWSQTRNVTRSPNTT